jgi:hypothetical protein
MARDEFDDDRSGLMESLPIGLITKILAGVAVLGVIGYAAVGFMNDGGADSSAPVPIIRADTSPLKEEPEDKGGMAVPNANSTIFETLRGADDLAPRVENLLDEPEKPMDKEEVLPVQMEAKKEPITDVRLEQTGEDPVEKASVDDVKVDAKEEGVAQAQPKPSAPEAKTNIIDELKQEAGQEQKKAEEKKIEEKKEVKKVEPVKTGSSYVQLAAVKSETEARTQWIKLKAKYPSLAPLSLRVQRADLGEKGIFYRIQGGPTSADNAATICAKIKASGGNCVIWK